MPVPGLVYVQAATSADACGVAHARQAGHAMTLEAPVGDVAGMDLTWLRAEVRHRVGGPALQLPDEVAAIVDATLVHWPERHMADLARRAEAAGAGREALDAIGVISAKVREVLELRCETDEAAEAVNLIVLACVVEVANLWFASTEHRIGIRRLAFQVRSRAA